MATRASLTPLAAEMPASNFAPVSATNARPVLLFDAATSETAYWTLVAPQGLTGTMTAIIHYLMASATTGGVAWDVALEAITPGDSTDLDATTSFDAVNGGSVASVPGTAGYPNAVSVTLTNADSLAAGDGFRLSLARDVADANDTASGDACVWLVEFRDGA